MERRQRILRYHSPDPDRHNKRRECCRPRCQHLQHQRCLRGKDGEAQLCTLHPTARRLYRQRTQVLCEITHLPITLKSPTVAYQPWGICFFPYIPDIYFTQVRGIAWKAILSEAVVTGGEALGMSVQKSCLKGSTSYQNKHIARYCLTDSCPPCTYPPGTLSRCSSPSGQIASESGRFA